MILLILGLIAAASASPAQDNKDTYKDQYCTDPRTMRKHAAYTEWADAYSCTRHRCQPGGRNLAIYTVGCKRVEAPESAIECEEVVEDTNMQFPFCCTRLRCLVVVRGEVWTRVLGQPWEVLPAAPWSHMYKMKKPPPSDTTFLPKTSEQGPVYELSEPESDGGGHEKVLRSGKKPGTDNTDCNEVVPRAAAPPDIVIALSTTNEVKEHKKSETRRSQIKTENSRHKRARKTTPSTSQYFEEERERERDRDRERENRHPVEPDIQELEELPLSTEKPPEISEERFYANTYGITQKPSFKSVHHQVAWTEIPQNQWNDHESMDLENRVNEPSYHQPEFQAQEAPEKPAGINILNNKDEKPTNLQALVDAIGTRMRDIENVVQRMSEKVHQVKPGAAGAPGGEASAEKRRSLFAKDDAPPPQSAHVHVPGRCSHSENPSENRRPSEAEVYQYSILDTKRPSTKADHYKRFTVRNRGSKYLHSTDVTTDQPLFIEDTNLKGYFSDASNSVLRRNNPPKEPPPTYMAPVDNRRRAPAHIAAVSDNSDDAEKKRKKHTHKKRRNKNGHTHKKHHTKDDKRKHFNRLSSVEMDKNVVSLEDSSAIANK